MAEFNPRYSAARPTPHSNARTRKEEEDSYMTLPDKEIAGCISDIGINFSVADLQKPQPQQIQKVFEWFAELLMNVSRDVVAPAMKSASDDVAGQYSDTFSSDTRDLMGFFVVMRKMLAECGIHDFSFADLYRPERSRLVKIFSYIINFIRFRESQTDVIDEHFNKAEKTKQKIESLYSENQAREDRLAELERNRVKSEAMIREREANIEDIRRRLNELQEYSPRVSEKLEKLKQESTRLKNILEDKTTQKIVAHQEAEKLRPYTTQSPKALEQSLSNLTASWTNDKSQTEKLDRRSRALQVSSEAFSTVAADVQSCTLLLHDLSRDLAAEEQTVAAAARNQDALSDVRNKTSDVEREEAHLKTQLENMEVRTERLRKRAEERRDAEARRMEELRLVNENLKRERGESGREMERRRVRIEQTEKKMADLKENIENEVHSAHAEFIEMDSHIRSYISQMEQSIA